MYEEIPLFLRFDDSESNDSSALSKKFNGDAFLATVASPVFVFLSQKLVSLFICEVDAFSLCLCDAVGRL